MKTEKTKSESKSKTVKPKIHVVPNYLLNPTHPITINLIGVGGTGSQLLSCLARIDHCLRSMGKAGLHVIAYDADEITQANIGRQLFYESDLGLNKATVLITRINACFGSAWEAIPENFDQRTAKSCNLTVSCVDTVQSRLEIAKILKTQKADKADRMNNKPYETAYYWMDFGNGADTGQVILGTLAKLPPSKSKQFELVTKLPTVTEQFDLTAVDENDSGPSCSLAEALTKQDLFINSTLAQLGSNILWKLLTDGIIDKRGVYLNLKTLNSNPVPL